MERKMHSLDGGGWFDLNRATKYEEDQMWDGNNYRSKATGDKFTHQALFKTASLHWVLHSWSQWQGSVPTWSTIPEEDAFRWLIANGYGHEVPEKFLAQEEV